MDTPDLPMAFCHRMSYLLGDEWPEFSASLQNAAWRAVRLHRWATPNRLTDWSRHPSAGAVSDSPCDDGLQGQRPPDAVSSFLAVGCPLPLPVELEDRLTSPVPWAPDAFYLAADLLLGKTIQHEAGAFYLQEPSAMAVVEALAPVPGERVLDLCAAPGGKATAIGRALAGTGLLVANEVHPKRVTVLAQNFERLGVPGLVVHETADRLAQAWPQQFDAVLVDAPCSGEGMFRKDFAAREAWSEDAPAACAARQRDILRAAVRLVRPGGRIIYSTCTFNAEENEGVVSWAVRTLPVTVEPLPHWPGWSEGRPEWADDRSDLRHTRRLWPHVGRGEGHFIARLRVTAACDARSASETGEGVPRPRHRRQPVAGARAERELWNEWAAEATCSALAAAWRQPVQQGGVWFAPPPADLPLTGLHVLRPGIPLGTASGTRWIPHHALAMALSPRAAARTVCTSPTEAAAWLRGEALERGGLSPTWHWVHAGGLPMGWGKAAGDRVNNHVPKGLRKAGLRDAVEVVQNAMA
ncbi:MAG: RsmF rRNA methyltransferase first C-terminal domain-containing protein [Alicyclobacillus sp.]|nr:RsmF rRNA methyltransferase first C-terminal domain-containing protein [Alicyclobacillus sp.]